MRFNVLSCFVLLFCACTLWCGEPEKVAEKPKGDIPQNVKTILDTYDQQMKVEKQKYLNIVLKFQKDLKGRLEAEIKTAEQKGKTELVTVLTEKVKQLEENTVEDNFVALGFPGEVKKSTKKMLEEILSSKEWVEKRNPEFFWSFKKGNSSTIRKGKTMIEKDGKVVEKEFISQPKIYSYKIDIEKELLYIQDGDGFTSSKISEKELVFKNGLILLAIEQVKKNP